MSERSRWIPHIKELRDAHDAFVERKVAAARASMQAGRWHDAAEVEAEFAARRARVEGRRSRSVAGRG